jgi:bacterioferritin
VNGVLETDLIAHYAEAMRFCLLIQDHDNEAFFRVLWNEELQHGEELENWLESLGDGSSRERQRAVL